MNACLVVLVFGGFLISSYLAAARMLAGRATSTRLCGTGTLFVWSLTLAFHVLSVPHWVQPGAAVAVSMALVAATLGTARHRERASDAARSDAAAIRAGAASLCGPATVVLVAAALFVVMLVIPRGLVSPPLAWDDLTYHLFKAGSWARAGGFTALPGPNAAGYYDYFPAGGESLWTWFLVVAPSGAFVVLGSVAVWALALLAAFAAARRMGAGAGPAAVAAAAIVSVPASASFVESSYVDNLALAAFLLGFTFLLDGHRRFGWGPAFLALASLAVGAGTKSSGLPLLALGVIWLSGEILRTRSGDALAPERNRLKAAGRRLGILAAITVMACAVAAPWYVRAWLDHGSPLYPLDLSAPGVRLDGDAQLRQVLSGEVFGLSAPPSTVANLLDGLVDTERSLRASPNALNLQPFPVLWVLLALSALPVALRDRRLRAATWFLVAVAGVTLVGLLAPGAYTLRVVWSNVLGRLLLPGFASVILIAACRRDRVTRALFVAMTTAQLLVSTRNVLASWSWLDTSTLGDWATRGTGPMAVLVLVAGLAVACDRIGGGRRVPRLGLAAAAVGAIAYLLGPPLDATRIAARYSYYSLSARGQVYRLHGLGLNSCAWPLWQAVDDSAGAVVAFTSGFAADRLHVEFRAPFLGSRLQNTVIHLPITPDGGFVEDVGAGPLRAIDDGVWLKRLTEARVDYVAVIPPSPPEAGTISRHPERFEPVAEAECSTARLYRLLPEGS